mgnify:CR=1 FL=1
MSNLYRQRSEGRPAFESQIFSLFTDAVKHGTATDFANILYGRHTVDDFMYCDDYNYWSVHGYFKDVVIPHKIAVFKAGEEFTKSVWFQKFIAENLEVWIDNLYLHDISKFSANEAFGYAFHDFKNKEFNPAFEKAWNHHKHHNEHHPEHWISTDKAGSPTFLQMPRIYIAEMVADWIGAGKVYGKPLSEWLPVNLHKFKFDERTAVDLQFFLHKIGIETVIYSNTENGVSMSTKDNPIGF